jgi:hypothetical protein
MSAKPAAPQPVMVNIAALPPNLAYAHELLQQQAQQLNNTLAKMEQITGAKRDSKEWQEAWTLLVRRLAALMDLCALLDLPIVRLCAREMHRQRQEALTEAQRQQQLSAARRN